MRRQLLAILVANLLLAPAAAQEGLKPPAAPAGDYKWFGNVGVGGITTSYNSQNPWKLFEYRDLDDGILSNIDIRGRGERSYVDAFVENIGRTDAYFDVRGARYNQFKYQVYGNWLQHNLSFGPDGGRSPYSGIGSATLTTVFPQLNSNVPPWNSFDFETKNQEHRRLLRALEHLRFALVPEGGREPGPSERHQPDLQLRGDEPGQRVRRPALPGGLRHQQLERRGRLLDEAGAVLGELSQEQVHQRQRNPRLDQPVLRREQPRLHHALARQRRVEGERERRAAAAAVGLDARRPRDLRRAHEQRRHPRQHAEHRPDVHRHQPEQLDVQRQDQDHHGHGLAHVDPAHPRRHPALLQLLRAEERVEPDHVRRPDARLSRRDADDPGMPDRALRVHEEQRAAATSATGSTRRTG